MKIRPTGYPLPLPLRQTATGCLILAVLSVPALAADALSPDSAWMFGDWNGYRTRLQDEGIKFDVNYTQESAASLGGGANSASTLRYSDQWTFATNFDLEKLLNWQDAEFQMTVTNRDGQNLSDQVADKRTGMLSSVQEVYGRGQTWRLTQFWVRKGLFDDVVDVKAGRVTVGEDFDNFDGNLFQNLALGSGQAGNWRGDRWFNWPVSQWGGRVKLNLTPDVFFQVGIYNQNPANYDRGEGFRLDTRHSEGNLVPVELGWKPTFGPANLPGNYRLGYYTSSVKGDVYDSWRNGYQEQARAYGGYLLLQQQLTAQGEDAARGVGVRAQAVMNDHKTAKTDNYQSIAVTWTGPFDARPEDEIGAGVARIHVNSDYSRSLRQQNQAAGESRFDSPTYLPVQQGSEYDYEIYYNAKVTHWLSLRPNLQYVVAPGGVSEVKEAFIGGISANIAF